VAKVDTYALYNPFMSSDCGISRRGGGTADNPYVYTTNSAYDNRPVNDVCFWDACRFANWLHNGQPTGAQDLTTTEDGSYYLNGATSDAALLAVALGGMTASQAAQTRTNVPGPLPGTATNPAGRTIGPIIRQRTIKTGKGTWCIKSRRL
jgi:hypothetical protein